MYGKRHANKFMYILTNIHIFMWWIDVLGVFGCFKLRLFFVDGSRLPRCFRHKYIVNFNPPQKHEINILTWIKSWNKNRKRWFGVCCSIEFSFDFDFFFKMFIFEFNFKFLENYKWISKFVLTFYAIGCNLY